MNKARRHELKMLKYKKRLQKYGLTEGANNNLYAFRSHGAPCSCYMCSHSKFERANEKRFELQLLTDAERDAARNPAYELLVP